MKKQAFGLLCVAVAAFALLDGDVAAQGKKPAGKNHKVKMLDNKFDPAKIEIAVGDTITWVNEGKKTHTATSEKGVDVKEDSFDTKDVEPGKSSKAIAFKRAGKVPYHCLHHAKMKGEIVVK